MLNKDSIQDLIERLSRLGLRYERDAGALLGLQPIQIEILKYLENANHFSDTPLAVADFFLTTKGTISQSIKQLETKGFLSKTADKKDKRSLHLHLTDLAISTLANLKKQDPIHLGLSNIELNDQNELERILKSLLVNLQKRNGQKTFGICHSCRHFRKNVNDQNHQCGLTLMPLTPSDSEKWCREHSA